MGILLCEQNFRDVWRRNKSVRAEIGKILRTHTKFVVRMYFIFIIFFFFTADHNLDEMGFFLQIIYLMKC